MTVMCALLFVCVWLGVVSGLGLAFTNPVGTGGVWDLCCNCVCGESSQGLGRCESGLFVYLAGPCICILC